VTEDRGRQEDIQEEERDSRTGIRNNKTSDGISAIFVEGARESESGMGTGVPQL
jgi:hypothetical protein